MWEVDTKASSNCSQPLAQAQLQGLYMPILVVGPQQVPHVRDPDTIELLRTAVLLRLLERGRHPSHILSKKGKLELPVEIRSAR